MWQRILSKGILNIVLVYLDFINNYSFQDHLRKHARSHIARKVKAELSQQMAPANSNNTTNQQEQSDALQHVHIIQQQSHNNSPQMHHQTC